MMGHTVVTFVKNAEKEQDNWKKFENTSTRCDFAGIGTWGSARHVYHFDELPVRAKQNLPEPIVRAQQSLVQGSGFAKT